MFKKILLLSLQGWPTWGRVVRLKYCWVITWMTYYNLKNNIQRMLHSGTKICILFLSDTNNTLGMTTADEKINRGYYMPAHGYEFYLRVFNSISHEFAALTHEISSWTREDKIRIHKRACVLFIIQTY